MVRVLTLNLWGRHGAWTDRRAALIAGLRAARPDLVAFQEAFKDEKYDQVRDLLGPEFSVAHQTVGLLGDGNHGASIASRWPLGDVRELDLHVTHRTADYPCAALVAEIHVPDPTGPLLFVNHAPSWQWGVELERELQAVAAARFVEDLVSRRGLHVVLAGDFNAVPEAASVRFWCGQQSLGGTSVGYQDAWGSAHPGEPGHTASPRNPLRVVVGQPRERGRRIDYVLLRCSDHGPTLEVAACALAFDEPVGGVWASDHFGVVADLVVPSG